MKENNGKIYYISPYLPEESEFKKYISPAAQSKVGYIRSAINDDLITVSVNCSLNAGNLYSSKKEISDDNGTVCILPTLSSSNRILLPICYLRLLISVFIYVLFNVKKDDIVILYHSVLYDKPVLFLKRFLKYKLIYEVEEIYADVRSNGRGSSDEVGMIQKKADAYIFPTEMLNEKINDKGLLSLIIYGSYNCLEYKSESKIPNNKIKIVYSGTLIEGKGVDNVIRCATHLDNDYEIHIIGFGSEEDIIRVKQLINQKKSECKVFFDGLKHGNEYREYLEQCDIGLCIQSESQLFNNTSFPSKILSYLGCGLKVIVSHIPAVEKSRIAPVITFAKSSKPDDVAEAIKSTVGANNYNSRSILQEFHNITVDELKKVFVLLRKMEIDENNEYRNTRK